MSESLFKLIFDGHPPALKDAKGMTVSGIGTAKAIGCVHLPFWVSGRDREDNPVTVELETTFFVMPSLGEGVLIGLDVLAHYSIDTLISKSCARLQTERGPVVFPIQFAPSMSSPRDFHSRAEKVRALWSIAYSHATHAKIQTVKTMREEWVPPRSHKFLKVCRLKGAKKATWHLSPLLQVHSANSLLCSAAAAVVRTCHSGKGGVGILVSNISDKPVRMPAHSSIAEAEPLSALDIITNDGESFHLRTFKQESPKGHYTATARFPESFTGESAPDPRKTEPISAPFDPTDEEDSPELSESRAKVELKVPSKEYKGCRVATDASGNLPVALTSAIDDFPEAFSLDGSPGRVKMAKPVTIPLKDGASASLKPEPLRPLGKHKRTIEGEELKRLIEWDAIEPSSSTLSFPIVIVRQGDKWRYCIDYRQLNRHTISDAYPMQRSDTIFASLGGMQWFSSLDAARGYHQLPLAEEDRWKTAFGTHHGFFQYKTMPFGLKNAPAIFQRFMETQILANLRWKSALVYIDDVIVFTKTLEEHSVALREILTAAKKVGLKFSAKKCFLGYPSLKLLGRMISREGLTVVEEKTKAIQELPTPRSLKELYLALGLFGYYRAFIIDFAGKAKPLTELTKGIRYREEGGRWVCV